MASVDGGFEVATFGGGCFWCLEAMFCELRGVDGVVSGYAGGTTPDPTYKEVCTGSTGHAEVVQITFDPRLLSFGELVEVFFATHDPTTRDRQGADVGSQYRSVVLAHDERQREVARRLIVALDEADTFGAPIVTRVEALECFYPAEADHQEFYARVGDGHPYCRSVISPKVAKLRRRFAARLRQPS
jgi:peptide-methionine (S)-S-oxide reductase